MQPFFIRNAHAAAMYVLIEPGGFQMKLPPDHVIELDALRLAEGQAVEITPDGRPGLMLLSPSEQVRLRSGARSTIAAPAAPGCEVGLRALPFRIKNAFSEPMHVLIEPAQMRITLAPAHVLEIEALDLPEGGKVEIIPDPRPGLTLMLPTSQVRLTAGARAAA